MLQMFNLRLFWITAWIGDDLSHVSTRSALSPGVVGLLLTTVLELR